MSFTAVVTFLAIAFLCIIIALQSVSINKLRRDKITTLEMYMLANTDVVTALDAVTHIMRTYLAEHDAVLNADQTLRTCVSSLENNRRRCGELRATL